MQQQPNKIIQIAKSGYKDTVLALLDEAKDYIADARNGDWTTQERKGAIVAIDSVIYNKIKAISQKDNAQEPEHWL